MLHQQSTLGTRLALGVAGPVIARLETHIVDPR
jgi:predicted transcriptional regulator